MTNDLYGALKAGNDPKWDLYIQVLNPQDLAKFDYDALDDTKIRSGVPERKVGTLTLNRVPDNYFETTEESAFAPSRMVPGIEPSEDRMLQGRMFAYADTQMYRLGSNFNELPIDRPRVPVVNNNRDGAMNGGDRKGEVNYEPSTLGEIPQNPRDKYVQTPLTGATQQAAISKTLDFRQAGEYYRTLSTQDRQDLVTALSADLNHVTNDASRYTMLSYLTRRTRITAPALRKPCTQTCRG
jgi:catalase